MRTQAKKLRSEIFLNYRNNDGLGTNLNLMERKCLKIEV